MQPAQVNTKRVKFDQIMAMIQAGDLEAAQRTLDNVRRLDPQELNFLNLAAVLAGLRGDNDRSIALYRQVLKRAPDHQEARFNLLRAEAMKAEAARDLKAALAAMQAALQIAPQEPGLLTQIALLRRQMCDFTTPLALPRGPLPPADAIVLTPDPAVQYRGAVAWAKQQFGAIKPLPPIEPRAHDHPIRLGFLSSDFHEHATAYLIAELFALFDRKDFSVQAYSYGVDDQSPQRQRIAQSCDGFHDVRGLDAHALAQTIRVDAIDILIDLKGYTRGGRLDILAYRPAPVQMHWLGLPGTLGCDFIDYFIADPVVLPQAQTVNFSEKIICLPDSYQVNDRQRPLPPTLARAAYGSPEDAVVFASLNQTYKLTPDLLGLWAEILRDVPRSVLWLWASNDVAPDNIRAAFAAQGIEAGRIHFAESCGLSEHLQRYHAVDVALDTFPVGGHTTTSDALWLGVPVVTLPGESFVSRVAASLLHAVGLQELVAENPGHYRALAVDLAQNPERRAALRRHLTSHRMRLPLFATENFVKNISFGLNSAWQRYRQGLPPDHIAVPRQEP